MDEGLLFLGLTWSVMTWCVFVLCYRYGGWKAKIVRRFVGGLFLPASLIGLAYYTGQFRWLMLGGLVSYPLWLSLGYGGETTATKLWRRTVYGLGAGLAAGPFLAANGLWSIWVFHSLLCLSASIFYGLINPLSAVGEEGTLAGVFIILVVCSPLR